MKLKGLFFILFFVSVTVVKAQFVLSSDPAVFITDVGKMLNSANKESATQVYSSFSSAWSGFTDGQRKSIIETSQKMVKTKKFRAYPHFTDFYGALAAAKNKGIPSQQIDSLIYITSRVIEIYDGKQINNYFPTIRKFLENNYLYSSSYNKLIFTGGTFSFRFIEPKVEIYEEEEEYSGDDWGSKNSEDGEQKSMLERQEDFFSDWDNPQQVEDEWGTTWEDEVATEISGGDDILDVGYVPPIQPVVTGAVISFENADFTIVTRYDSVELKGTTGSMMFKDNVYVGKGGRFNWSCVGFAPEEIYCDFKEFNFNVQSPRLYAEGAELHYAAKTDSVVEGIFEFDSKRAGSIEDRQYPRFKSFKSNIKIKDLGQDIDYHGGLSLSGRKLYSSSVDEGTSRIDVYKDGVKRIQAIGSRFELGDSLITSDLTNIVLYQDQDSIYHPGTSFKFNKSLSILRLSKHNSFKQAPFTDTYHNIEIVADALIWDLNDTKIDFDIVNAKNQIAALFESSEFFNAEKYSLMMGMYKFHPLQLIVGYSDKLKAEAKKKDPNFKENEKEYEKFNVADLAEAYKIELNTLKGAMTQLMKTAYIDYNAKTGLVKLKPKAYHYVLSRRDKKDYDNITFKSISPGGTNATLDLTTNELIVRGVDKVWISDSLNVDFVPNNREIKILKNRDFLFDGKINTESFQFEGTDFQFDYDSFLVHLPNIDKIKLAVKDEKDLKNRKATVLSNELRYSSGTLYINDPNNKSGRKRMEQYPIFDASTGATVFFDKAHIGGGVYDTTMKFEIPPFKIDSLSSADPNHIGFDGKFKSGIFPDFDEKLVVMPDLSLGFTHKVPTEGYQLYGGKGKYFSDIVLNNKGLRGDGSIHYLTTTLYSNDFFFCKDSVLTQGTNAETKEGTCPEVEQDVTFPEVNIQNYRLKWYPRVDSMFISNEKDPFNYYKGTAKLHGTSIVRENGMFGRGVLFTRGSEAESMNFHFEQDRFSGRDAFFLIESDNPNKPALKCDKVKLDFDLVKNFAYFSPEQKGYASNEFPYAQYKSSLDNGEWDLENKKVYMQMEEGGDISKSYFYSTRPDQDSLVFNATHAVYDIPRLNLNISGVPFIKVADGKIFPDSNRVVVLENAVIKTLKNAKITIDTINEYHHLYDGIIDIRGRKKFEGVATYQYVNLGSDTLAIRFQDFRLEESEKRREGARTVATGMVKEDDSLTVGPKIFYKGKVVMHANNPLLLFDGFVKLDLKGALSYSQWLKYVNDGSSKDVVLSLENAMADNGAPLTTGIHLDKKGYQLYTTFISQKKEKNDADIFSTTGILEYNADTNEFRVGKPDKLNKSSLQGNLLKYDDTKSFIEYSGKFNFFENQGKVKMLAAGRGHADLNIPEYKFQTFMAIDFGAHATATNAIAKNLKIAKDMMPDTALLTEADYVRLARMEETLFENLAQFIGNDGVKKYQQKKALEVVPLFTLSSDFSKSFVFSNVDLTWSPDYKAFYSSGPIYVTSIMKEEINKSMPGFVEIRKTSKGDIISVYLEPTPNTWYFMTYEDNRTSMLTSNEEVNAAIASKSKGEQMDRSKFFYVKGDLMEKVRFVDHFKEHYLGIDPSELEKHRQQEMEQMDKDDDIQDETEDEIPEIIEDQPDMDDEIGVDDEEPSYNTNTDKKSNTKSKKDDRNYDKYKINNESYDEEDNGKERQIKEQSIERQQQSQKDQQKMKDLFK